MLGHVRVRVVVVQLREARRRPVWALHAAPAPVVAVLEHIFVVRVCQRNIPHALLQRLRTKKLSAPSSAVS